MRAAAGSARCLAFQVFLAFNCLASRVDDLDYTDSDLRHSLLAGTPESICGGKDIWELATVAPTRASVPRVQWETIRAKADDYIEEQAQHAKVLEIEIGSLGSLIEEQRSQESRAALPPEKAAELLALGLVELGGFDGAVASQCGHPLARQRAQAGAYRRTVQSFPQLSARFFDGTYRLDGEAFHGICAELLPCTPGAACNCGRLCKAFQTAAQRSSDSSAQNAAADGHLDSLLETQKERLSDFRFRQREVRQCEKDKEAIREYSESLSDLRRETERKFEGVQAAELAVEDARRELAELGEALEDHEGSAGEALRAVYLAGRDGGLGDGSAELQLGQPVSNVSNLTENATKALEKAQEEEESGKKAVKKSAGKLADTSGKLESAQEASRIVAALKARVSAVAAKLRLYYQVSVQEPIRDLGITEDMDLDQYFYADPTQIPAAGLLKGALASMQTYCREEATRAFDKVNKTLDLSPLCNFRTADEAFDDLNNAVLNRTAIIKREIESVKARLDPYWGQIAPTEAELQQALHAGEPAGLRQIAGVYGSAAFYRSYLKEWTADGDFVSLATQLGELVTSLGGSMETAQQDLNSTQAQLSSLVQSRERAHEELRGAAGLLQASSQERKKLDRTLLYLGDATARMKSKLGFLQEHARVAREQWQVVKAHFARSHEEALSMLQEVQEERSLAELAAKSRSADEQVEELELAVARARRSSSETEEHLRWLSALR